MATWFIRMKIFLQEKNKKNLTLFTSGFTIFLAVIVSGLLLLVVLSISNLALKETILSGAGRESELAFFAADSGVECALFWDYQNPDPVTGFQREQGAFISPIQNIECGAGVTYQSPSIGVGFNPADYPSFDPGDPFSINKPVCNIDPVVSNFTVTFDNGTCTILSVSKCYDGTTLKTQIESRGRSSCDLADPRRFERAIRVIYP